MIFFQNLELITTLRAVCWVDVHLRNCRALYPSRSIPQSLSATQTIIQMSSLTSGPLSVKCTYSPPIPALFPVYLLEDYSLPSCICIWHINIMSGGIPAASRLQPRGALIENEWAVSWPVAGDMAPSNADRSQHDYTLSGHQSKCTCYRSAKLAAYNYLLD